MNQAGRRILFFLFFLSGLSSLVYQVVWTRMAFASFGTITPVLSVVLSVFMLGLAVGSWAGGRWIVALTQKTGVSAVLFYAGVELLIGIGAFAVPKLFTTGEQWLLAGGGMDSFHYLSLSALVLAASILPWCLCMGATFPLMMAYIREREDADTGSFSFLYLANVLGAMSGTLLSAVVWIELLGFHHTLWLAAAGNATIAFISVCLAWEQHPSGKNTGVAGTSSPVQNLTDTTSADDAPSRSQMTKWILFSTGFVAMAMEVVWTRAFTPVLKTQVYSFAAIVFVYLGATFLGSWKYRRDLHASRRKPAEMLIPALAVAALIPVLVNSPKFVVAFYRTSDINLFSACLLLAGIVPFCALLGYLTPGLVDDYAAGNPARAGRAYAINVLGCILGPLLACYLLLPRISERYSLILLTLPFVVFCFLLRRQLSRTMSRVLPVFLALVLVWSALCTQDFEGGLKATGQPTVIRRDYAATVISYGTGDDRVLLVNGVGMTILTPITKFMVHLPLAFHQGPSQSALVICFGMGTTFRSAMSWNLDTTCVELVPGVTKAFGFYHADAARFLDATNGHLITDDGRRFLRRTTNQFDVIVVDPPPPVQAAGSSLLFSREFYDLAKQHLKPGGIIQMWYPGDNDPEAGQAVMRSLRESFPYVRCFPSIAGRGLHLLGSTEPIEQIDSATLAARMPASARQDLLEWESIKNAPAFFDLVLRHEQSVTNDPGADATIQVTDDRPYNEYFLFRHLLNRLGN